ncbi:hypothetical protein [Verrucomicrobium spinosum]|nr:hypothetical protein [Verrucomicrobium spinosum]
MLAQVSRDLVNETRSGVCSSNSRSLEKGMPLRTLYGSGRGMSVASLLNGAIAGLTMLTMGSCSPKSERDTNVLSKAEPSNVAAAPQPLTQGSGATAAPVFVVQTSPSMTSRTLEARSSIIPGREAKSGSKTLRAQDVKADQTVQVSPVVLDKQNRELMDALTVKPR